MKIKWALLMIAALVGSVVPTRANERFEGTGWTGMYDWSSARAMNEGNKLKKKGDYNEALEYYNAAIARDPKEWPAYFNRADVFLHDRNWNAAINDLNSVIRLKPDILLAEILRGWVNEQLGNYNRALGDYDHILSFQLLPFTHALALNCRAWLRATCRDTRFRNAQQAINDAKDACNLVSWRKPAYIDTLATAYAAAGDFDSAVRFEQQAVQHESKEQWRKFYQQRLAILEARHPVRHASR